MSNIHETNREEDRQRWNNIKSTQSPYLQPDWTCHKVWFNPHYCKLILKLKTQVQYNNSVTSYPGVLENSKTELCNPNRQHSCYLMNVILKAISSSEDDIWVWKVKLNHLCPKMKPRGFKWDLNLRLFVWLADCLTIRPPDLDITSMRGGTPPLEIKSCYSNKNSCSSFPFFESE